MNETPMTKKARFVLTLIRETNGRIFAATYLKKDGSPRRIVARYLETKDPAGRMNHNPIDQGRVAVMDLSARKRLLKGRERSDTREITLQTVTRFKCGAEPWEFE
jgi:hypothetical protein